MNTLNTCSPAPVGIPPCAPAAPDKRHPAPPTAPLETRMREYATRYLKRHPNTKSNKLARIVAKKFNVKLT